MPSPDASEGRERFLLIARACDDDPAGRSAEARIGFTDAPTDDDKASYAAATCEAFRQAMGADPDRVAVAVLPWADDLDSDDEGTARV